MIEDLDKWDIHTLKTTTSYRYFCIACMLIFAFEGRLKGTFYNQPVK
jgi:hypothetical protein